MNNPHLTRWGVVFLTLGAGIVVAFQVGKLPATIPVLRDELGISLVTAGWVVSLIYVASAITGLIAGAVSDMIGARRVVVAGVVCVGVASFGGAFADGAATLLISRFFEGIGAATVFVAGPLLVFRAVAAKDMRFAFGLWGSYMPAGIAIMLLLTPPLLDWVGWRGLWIVNAAILVVYAPILVAGTRSVPDAGRPGPRLGAASLAGDIKAVARSRGPLLLAVCFGTYSLMYLCLSAFLPTFLIETRGFAADWAAIVTALVVAANAFGNIFGGWLLQRGVPRGLLIGSAAATMGVTAWLVYQPWTGAVGSVFLAFVFSYFGGMLPPSVMSGSPVHAPGQNRIGTTNGLIMQGVNIGQLSGPPAFAAIVSVGGWSAGPLLGVAAATASVAAAIGIARIEARHVRAAG
ncbi:MAG: MFS transporter [Bauldia litoralis]